MRTAFLTGASILVLSSGTVLADPSSSINDSGYGNDNTVDQTLVMPEGTATSSIEQAADTEENTVGITQAGSGQFDAMVMQHDYANGNMVDINQAGAGQAGSMVTQYGYAAGNMAEIGQNGEGTKSVDVVQYGSGDMVKVDQTDFGEGGASTIVVDQDNDGNYGNYVAANQEGSENTAEITQNASMNSSTTSQTGSENSLIVLQQEGGNVASITQEGDGNRSNLFQYQAANIAKVDQLGNSNESSVSQFGVGLSEAEVIQEAEGGVSSILQNASGGHMAKVHQEAGADGAFSRVYQIGRNNTAYVTQTTANAYSNFEQAGVGGTIAVNQ